MKMRKKFLWISLPALLLAAGSVLAGPKQVTECGTILTKPGNYKLVNDLLDCPGEEGVTIFGSNITLNLKNHVISCADNDVWSTGVLVVDAKNVTVKNGHVANCVDGIVLVFVEDSKIMNISSTGNHKLEGAYGTGITLWRSSNNVIMKNHTFGNEGHGIGTWESSGNLFKHNTSTDNFGAFGIWAEDETNSQFMCNRTHGNVLGIGLAPGSNDNLVRGNFASGNQLSGISIFGYAWDGFIWTDIPSGNTVRSNIAEDNFHSDLSELADDWYTGGAVLDPLGTCFNTWEKNQFGTQFWQNITGICQGGRYPAP